MKTAEKLNKHKVPLITIDPALDQLKNVIVFPAKLEKANKRLQTAKLTASKHKS